MADVWNGDILLPDGGVIKDVGLASRTVASTLTLPATCLRFLSTVDTARIPLYLATGPSLDVWTTGEETEAWFESILLSRPAGLVHTPSDAPADEWWNLVRAQSPIGILVQVQVEAEETQKPRITEILFYGTIAATVSNGHLPELQVHALPLSSALLHHQSARPPPDGEAQFLPLVHNAQSTPTSPARKRDIFEEATITNKRARGRGGRGVADAASRATESQQPYVHRKSLSSDIKTSPFPEFGPPPANSSLARPSSRQLSRSPSISSDTRPLSRKDVLEAHSKRSTLSQVATVSLLPEEPTIESRNKEALSRVVMAAMRMHGLQQRKKTGSRRTSAAPGIEESQQLSEEAAKDEEYKLIYYQTYKGAALALRNHMSQKPLHAQSDRLRDVVEKLLTIFLTDPLAEPLHSNVPVNTLATPGSKHSLAVPGSIPSHASPFDLPSTARPAIKRSVTDTQAYTGSPVSKRKVGAT